MGESPHNSSILVDSDSQMFLNYLFFPIDGAEEMPREFANDLEHHRSLIISRLEEFKDNHDIGRKYSWAASYHDHFCEHMPGADPMKSGTETLVQPPRFLHELYVRKRDKMYKEGEEVATLKTLGQWEIEKEPE